MSDARPPRAQTTKPFDPKMLLQLRGQDSNFPGLISIPARGFYVASMQIIIG